MNDLLKEMRELIQKLNEASKAYYQEAREIAREVGRPIATAEQYLPILKGEFTGD